MLINYLFIGIIVQVLITTERFVRGQASFEGVFDTFVGGLVFVISFLLLAGINIILWPLAIWFEACNIKKEKGL